MSQRTVVICGNGASAAILLSSLARQVQAAGLSVVVIGTGEHVGQGIAYATGNPNHLLNVPASRMSAFPSKPDQFVQWLKRRKVPLRSWSDQFVSRALYAGYLENTVRQSLAANPLLKVTLLQGEVLSLIRDGLRWIISHDSGASLAADIVVLATGNDMPTPVSVRYPAEVARLIIDNPWGDLNIRSHEDVLILGSGLTALDAVISLLDRGHVGHIHLLSRHGLLPATHVEPKHGIDLETPFPLTTRGLLAALRASAGSSPAQWQGLVDAMRPSLPRIWQLLTDAEKRRFLRHGATYWNVHRHRLAPRISDRIHSALGKTVHLVKGRLVGLAHENKFLEARIVTGGRTHPLLINRLINCTGPNSDPNKTHDPLVENLIASRQARATSIGIGLDVDERNRVRDNDGTAQPSLFAMGALTRGRWWEITAIPEISQQAVDLTGHVLGQLSILDAAGRITSSTDFHSVP